MVDEENKRIASEAVAMRGYVADIMLAWGAIENSLAMLLATIVGARDSDVVYAIFFSSNSSESRLKMISAAVEHAHLTPPLDREVFLGCWGKLLKGLASLKDVRNKVAHGQIATQGIGTVPPRNYVRLIAPLFHPSTRQKRIPHGMSAADLKYQAARFGNAHKLVDELMDIRHRAHDLLGIREQEVRAPIEREILARVEKLQLDLDTLPAPPKIPN